MPAAGTRMARLWAREVGRLPPKRFSNAFIASEDFVRSLQVNGRLRQHRGCVNTVAFNGDGSLLLSGSDDRTVVLWNWDDAATASAFHTGHSNNVLHAQFMPFADDRSIVTCAADGEVRHLQVKEGGGVSRRVLVELDDPYPVHRMAVEPGSPHTFYCCGENGSVWHFDLRVENAVELFKCGQVVNFTGETIRLYAIAIDPRKPNYFAIGGTDEYARVYDIRKIDMDGSTNLGCPIEYFCPPHLIGNNNDGITGLAFSQTSELLASYSFESIYLFSRDHGLVFNNIDLVPRLLMDEYEDNVHYAALSPSSQNKLPVPQAFKGHRNRCTIKGVSFLGPNCEYVTSGSDSGHVFIWRKKDGELMRVMEGDKQIVNCVEQHPLGTVVASSGIANDIKIWAPGVCEERSILHIDEVKIEMNLWSSESSDSDGFDFLDYIADTDLDLIDDNANDEDDEDEDEQNDESDNSDEDMSEDMSEGMSNS